MLTNKQSEELYKAILRTFDESSLERLLAFRLDKNLAVISDRRENFSDIVFDVIRVARMEDWSDALIAELHKERPSEGVFYTLAKGSQTKKDKPASSDKSDESKNELQRRRRKWMAAIVPVGLFLFAMLAFLFITDGAGLSGLFGESQSVTPAPNITPAPSIKREVIGAHTMIAIPAGEFIMGSTQKQILHGVTLCDEARGTGACSEECCDDEDPRRTVTLDAYLIDESPVTNAMYSVCVDAGDCTLPQKLEAFENPERPKHPVVFVTWEQATAYCEAQGLQLPTEAEWEKAARGVDGRIYPWGDEFEPARLNSCDVRCDRPYAREDDDDGFRQTAPVGRFPGGVSPFGVRQMAGNVWEWTSDSYALYSVDDVDNPVGASDGVSKVVRGGSFDSAANGVRSADRLDRQSEDADEDLGFRCATDA